MEIPEITVQEVAEKIKNGSKTLILDVRELMEVNRASLPAPNLVVVPMSELAAGGVEAIPPEVREWEDDIVIICHHGIRSAQVAAWLQMQGWQNVINMAGGIDAYAREADPSVGTY